jgi:hypothetical protein
MTTETANAYIAAAKAAEAFFDAAADLNLAIQGEDEAFDWDAINRLNIAVSDGLTPFTKWVIQAA